MVLDHAERSPNPARDKRVRLPQEDRVEVNPATATHVLAVHGLLATRYRLPLLVLDATEMRVSELEALRCPRCCSIASPRSSRATIAR
jgi:hypothetical protein